MRKKYDAVTRMRVWQKIEALNKQGLKTTEIALKLQDEGILGPNKEPISGNYVSQVLFKISGGKRSRSQPAPSSGSLPEAVVGILKDAFLSDRQKIAMISAYAQL